MYAQQQQQQQMYGAMPDPHSLASLAIREQQLMALQGVRMELESLRLLADQVRRREKFKNLVSRPCGHARGWGGGSC
jgi:hypothetical protein